jgi:dolichol-phosphate mannosyltransferase
LTLISYEATVAAVSTVEEGVNTLAYDPARYRILVLVVTYNEAANIPTLVPEILRHLPSANVLVVDDNSPDGTAGVVRGLQASDDRVQLMVREHKRGFGSAIIAGLRHALANGYDVIATLDADFSHDPADLPRLVDALRQADVAIGSRYVGGIRILNWGVRRLLLSLWANTYIRLITGLRSTDCTSNFRAYRAQAFDSVALERISSTGYAFVPELLFVMDTARVHDVPICYTERRLGQSKMGKRVIVEAAIRPWALCARRLTRRLRVRPAAPIADAVDHRRSSS